MSILFRGSQLRIAALLLGLLLGCDGVGTTALAQTTMPIPVPTPTPPQPVVKPPQRSPQPNPNPGRSGNPTPPRVEFNRYRLGPGDSLFISVLRFPDLSFQGTVDLEGNLLVPLVGALRLEGLTLQQARGRLRQELDQFVVEPQVDLILIAQRPVRVTVLGQVVRPGFYPLESPQLASALASSGGTTSQANLRNVRIRRVAPNGVAAERPVDLYTPLRNGTAVPNIRLEDGDTVIVSALTAAERTTYDTTLVARSTLSQPQINVRVLNYSNSLGGSRSSRAIANVVLPNGSDFVDALAAISPNPDTANFRDIALIRYDPDQGRAVTQEFNGRRALRGDATENLILQNNDVIIIGRNFISRITYTLNTVTQPFRDVLGFLLFFDTISNSADNLFNP